MQNSFFFVKIGLWILTTNFTKQVINKKESEKDARHDSIFNQ